MIKIKDYRAMLQYGDIKLLSSLTGISPYLIKTRLAKGEQEMIEVVELFYQKRLEALKNQISDYETE